MIFADKLVALRKKNGWSQEELAELAKVSRQSVSKWEGAQSVPDLDKVLQLSRIFGVSVDYLLKDELEEPEYTAAPAEVGEAALRRVSLEEANEFLRVKGRTAPMIAVATGACILSPIPLFFFSALAEDGWWRASEDIAGGLGLTLLLLIVIAAVAVFIFCGMQTGAYEYLEKEIFETEYGVRGMVEERRARFHDRHTRYTILGSCLCIFAVIPLFLGGALFETDLPMVLCLCLTLLLLSVGVMLLILVGIPQASFEKLLEEGDYTREKKQKVNLLGVFTAVYWLVVVAVYLVYMFCTGDKRCVPLWAVAGVLYGAAAVVGKAIQKSRR